MSLKFIKMLQLSNTWPYNPMVHSTLGYSQNRDFLVKRIEVGDSRLYLGTLNLVLLREPTTVGTLVRKVGTHPTFTTTLTGIAAVSVNVINVSDTSGFHLTGATFTIAGDTQIYTIDSVTTSTIMFHPALLIPQSFGAVVTGTVPDMTIAARLTADANSGTNQLTTSVTDILDGMILHLGHDPRDYKVIDIGVGALRVAPALTQTYPTNTLVYSFDPIATTTTLRYTVEPPANWIVVENVDAVDVGDLITLGNDLVQYEVLVKTPSSNRWDLSIPVADKYLGRGAPYAAKEYHLYSPDGTPIRSSPLQLNIDGEIVSVAYDASSKLQYFLMTYLKADHTRAYYIIRGDLVSQVFHLNTRTPDLKNLSGAPLDIAIYQNGVYILADTNIVHFYSLAGTHRQKIEFNNFKVELRTLDYFADFVSTYNHIGKIYPEIGVVEDASEEVVINVDDACVFNKSASPNGAGYDFGISFIKLPEFATLEISTEEEPVLNEETEELEFEFVVPINAEDPPEEFPFPIWHQMPKGKIMEGPLSGGNGTGVAAPSGVTIGGRKYLHEFSMRELLISDGVMHPLSFYQVSGQPGPNWAERNTFLDSDEPEYYTNKAKFFERVSEWRDAFTLHLESLAASSMELPDFGEFPLRRTFVRWLMLYDKAGYVYVWDLILSKIVFVSRTGMHYQSNRTACNLGVEKYSKSKEEVTRQLIEYITPENIDDTYAALNAAGIAELDVTVESSLSHKTFDEFLDAMLNSYPVILFNPNAGSFQVRVGSGQPVRWTKSIILEGVKTDGVDLEKSAFLSLHDYGPLSSFEEVGVSNVILEHDAFVPVIGSNPNGIALVAHELRNENPQFTFTVKLFGNVGEPVGRQRIYAELFVYNDTTFDAQTPAWHPDPIFVFTDDRGLATGTVRMPDIPIEGHIVLKFAVQAIAQPDKSSLYIYNMAPNVIDRSGGTFDLYVGLWKPPTQIDAIVFNVRALDNSWTDSLTVVYDEDRSAYKSTLNPADFFPPTKGVYALQVEDTAGKLSNEVLFILK